MSPARRQRFGIAALTIATIRIVAFLAARAAVAEPALPVFDFTRAEVAAEWRPANHVASLRGSGEGLLIEIDGEDPYVTGPPRDYPSGLPLRMTLRIKPEIEGMLQVFHYRDHATEERSVAFAVRADRWNDVRALVPAFGPGFRLRIDPPGASGTAVVARIGFEPAASLPAPRWPAHERFDTSAGQRLRSGPLTVEVAAHGFALAVDGRRVAASHARPLVGYVADGATRWAVVDAPAEVRREVDQAGSAVIEAVQSIRDADGGGWRFRRRFAAGRVPGVIDLEATVTVDVDREIAFMPLVLLVAHEGTPRKTQAVFPGLEYLADEPSSSEADLVGPPSRRQVPASHKIAFPLQAVAHDGVVVGLAWDHALRFAALFDSPDRVLDSGGHLMGVIAPGSDGLARHEGDLMPIEPVTLNAGVPLVLRAELVGIPGETIVPAVRAFVGTRGLPEVPTVGGFDDYVRLATAGWLDSGVRAGGRFRHAIGTNFPPQPAADAAAYTAWLAGHADTAMQGRLEEASAAAIAEVPAGSPDAAVIGHVRMPMQSLVFGRVEEAVAEHAATARRLLADVRPDGTVAYRPAASGVDYGRTHDADHASGLSAKVVADALEAARFAGDDALVAEAVKTLRRLGKTYAGNVPRGAQTWEVPLHTPDILASAHMVRAFTIGYELTRDRELLDEAVTWAWTGLPFLYLVDPVGTSDGPYGCVTVFGATAWKWPVWIGRPVQWCGLVYAHALYRLAPHDPSGPWKRLADGITAVGIRYSWPVAGPATPPAGVVRQGLLPDGWEVLDSFRVDPPINPGTLQACAVELFGRGPLVDCRALPWGGRRLIVHAPGAIDPLPADAGLRFTVSGWPKHPYAVLVTGVVDPPGLEIDGRSVPLAPPHRFDAPSGRLVIELEGRRTVRLRPAVP